MGACFRLKPTQFANVWIDSLLALSARAVSFFSNFFPHELDMAKTGIGSKWNNENQFAHLTHSSPSTILYRYVPVHAHTNNKNERCDGQAVRGRYISFSIFFLLSDLYNGNKKVLFYFILFHSGFLLLRKIHTSQIKRNEFLCFGIQICHLFFKAIFSEQSIIAVLGKSIW